MRKLICLVILAVMVSFTSTTIAGDLRYGLNLMPVGHSNEERRCIDSGWGVEIGYDHTLYNHNFNSLISFDVDVGPELVYSNYQTAYREKASHPRSDRRRESSLNLSGIIKPTFNIGRVSLYGIGGIGRDWQQENGHDGSYTYGAGVDLRLTNKVSFGVSAKNINRNDTGTYTYITTLIKMPF